MNMKKYKNVNNKEGKRGIKGSTYLAIGALIGIIVFITIYGIRILNVTYTDWLMSSGDLTQHYVGWEYFRDSPWAFPIGMSANYGYPIGVTVTYTDSIPLLAIPFKLLREILPTRFQYFGMWGLICFALQGGIAAVIFKKYIKNISLVSIATIFILISPPMLRKMFNHTALGAHWLILLSLAVWVYKEKFKSTKSRILTWTCINIMAILIHPYFIPMTMSIMLGFFIDELIYNKKIKDAILTGMTSVISVGIVFWVIGGFVGESAEAVGLGEFSMNINSLINPIGWSKVINDLPVATVGQYEGFQYLGLGMIIIAVVCIILFILKNRKLSNIKFSITALISFIKRYTSLFVVFSILFIMALSNIITLNDKIIFEYKLPGPVEAIFNIFRSTGRLFWPITYIIMFALIIYIIKSIKSIKIALIFIVALLSVQIYDLSAKLIEIRDKFATEIVFNTTIKSDLWNGVGESFDHMMILPAYISDFSYLSQVTTDYGMTLNTGSYARGPYNQIAEIASLTVGELKEGKSNDDTIYVIQHFNVLVDIMINAPKDRYTVVKADKYWVLYSNKNFNIDKYKDHIKVYTSKDFEKVELKSYLDALLNNNEDDIAVMISKKGYNVQAISDEEKAKLEALGLKIDLSQLEDKNYVGFIIPGNKEESIEKSDINNVEILMNEGTNVNGNRLQKSFILRAGKNGGTSFTNLLINQYQYSMNREGLNILVYDVKDDKIINIANFELKDNNIGRVMKHN